MNEQEKLIEEQLKTLPPNLQQAINAVPWKTLVQEIGKAKTLDAEQIVALEQETMFIIHAFENPNDYVSNIVREVGVSEEVAYTIAESVANKIFDPILEKSEEHENAKESHANLPMIEEGEVAHDVAHVEPTIQPARQDLTGSESPKPKEETKPSLPDYRYEGGKDPYREPLV